MENYLNNIYDNINEFYILYTTWKTEDTSKFNDIFPNSYIKQIDNINIDNYIDIINNYDLDNTNKSNGNNIENYIKYLYIKTNSLNTIIDYEKINNITFDIIITIRPDILISKKPLSDYYTELYNNPEYILLPQGPSYDMYNQGAYQCSICLCSRKNIELILSKLKILKNLTLDNCNIFHPETTGFKLIKYYNLKYKFVDYYIQMIR
jgi:hypothetical protein